MNKEFLEDDLRKLIEECSISARKGNFLITDDLVKNNILDSYSLVQLIMKMELTFDIVFNFEDYTLNNFLTMQNIKDLLIKNYSVKFKRQEPV